MPLAPKRFCNVPRCPKWAAREGRCEDHQRKRERGKSEAWHHLYNTPVWKRLRRAHLAGEPLCRKHRKQGQLVVANEVDHVVPHEGDVEKFFDPDNLQSLCKSCHSSKTMTELNAR